MKLKFVKMQAAGNDYIYVDCRDFSLIDAPKVAEKLSLRRYSVGADGLVLIKRADGGVKAEIYNADGTRAPICGNALRCVARLCFDRFGFDGDKVDILTDSGNKTVEKIVREYKTYYRVNMGRADVTRKCGSVYVRIGNLHRVEKADNVEKFDFFSLENFRPGRYNTEVYRVVGKNAAQVRVFERGSGETLACGSGAVAVAVAGIHNGDFTPGEVEVRYKGGALRVSASENGDCFLLGDAVLVYDGEVEI